ncbi:branched-chain amino acid ABC transporter permease [Microbacterium sp. RD1]|uniref:branched-chain amino acid ABC transporter permease n=1 Tax=Microbacterium sp. RD1 TaxID=3457313 RepID=UPI003FA588DC
MIVYAVTALSLAAVLVPLVASVSLVYRVSGVVNFGAGYFAIFAASACAAWSSLTNSAIGVTLTLLAGAVLGLLTYFIAILPAQRRGVSAIGLTLASLGVGLLLNFVTRSVFGGDPTVIQPWIKGTVTIGDFQTASQRFVVIGGAIVLLLVLWLIFDRTLMGRMLTAVAHDRELAAMYGIRGRRFDLVAWIASGVCLAIGGMFQASLATVSVEVAPTLLVFSLVGAVIGGLDNLFTAVGGALVLGLAVTITDQFISVGYQLVTLFIVLSLVLAFRPHGLFAFRGTAERV